MSLGWGEYQGGAANSEGERLTGSDAAADPPAISVILATNRAGSAPFLDMAIASVLAQRGVALELVIVDDGSPDPDAVGLHVPDDPRVRATRVDSRGVARARNMGAGLARGTLLAFIDDDDCWDPDRLGRHQAVMASEPEAVVSYCRMRTVDDSGLELAPGDQTAVRDIHDVYRRATGILMPNMVIRRDAFTDVGGFDPAFQIAEDLDLLLRLARLGRVVFVEGRVLVDYRAHENNTTRRHREVAESVRTVLRLHRAAALQRGDADLAADLAHSLTANGRYAAWSAARAARRMIRSGQVGSAAGELLWAASFAPGAPGSWLSRRLAREPR